MNETVGYFDSDDYGVIMRVVYPTCVSPGEDNVFWFWHSALWGAIVHSLHHHMRWRFCFASLFVSRELPITDLTGPSKYGSDLPLIG